MIQTAIRKAKEIYSQFKSNDLDPLNLDNVIEQLGAIQKYFDFPDHIRGCLMFLREYPYIGININHIRYTPHLAHFTKAHELAHLVLHPRKQYYCKDEQFYTTSDNIDLIEWEANSFAAELIMPTELIKKLNKQMTTAELSSHFGTSQEAVIYRLNNLGLI